MVSTLLTSLVLFAADQANDPGPPPGLGNMLNMLFPLLAIGLLFYFLLIRPQKRQQQQRQKMLAAVKKNDRVISSGGIYGVVTNVHAEADEITIKVDESTNTKLRMTLSSISRVLGDEGAPDSSKKT